MVLKKENEVNGQYCQGYCFVRFQYAESVLKALSHPDYLILNNLVL